MLQDACIAQPISKQQVKSYFREMTRLSHCNVPLNIKIKLKKQQMESSTI